MRHAPFAVYLLRLTIHFRTHIQAHIFFTIGKMAELGKHQFFRVCAQFQRQFWCNGGETGIRTLGTREGSTVFETAPFDHSGTSPRGSGGGAFKAECGPVQGGFSTSFQNGIFSLFWHSFRLDFTYETDCKTL